MFFYSENIRKALNVCYDAHKDQTDLAGTPFVFHPVYVAMQMPADNEDCVIVALLHDVVEKSNYTMEMLRASGFSDSILDVIQLLTYNKKESYDQYILHIRANEIARIVALTAISHNLDIERYRGMDFTEEERDSLEELEEQYEDAYRVLI